MAAPFFDFLFATSHGSHALYEVPIHLIGHSRGASLNSALSYALAVNGVLVDQVTTLDPHPVRPFDGNDWIPATYINVLFADNYWQSHLQSLPDGMIVPGAFNQDLSSVLTGSGTGPHTLVHTYYYGTIDLTLGNDGGGDYPDSNWYLQTRLPDETGYNFSRFTNPRLVRPKEGISESLYELNSSPSGTGSRTFVDLSSSLWPNAGFDQRRSLPDLVTVGQAVQISYFAADWGSQQTITFSLDADINAFNGIERDIGFISQNITLAGAIGLGSFSWTPTEADIGPHFIRVKANDPTGRARYDYFLKPITVIPTPTSAPTISSVTPDGLPPSPSPQSIAIYGSNFKGPSDPNASKLRFYDPAGNPTALRTPEFVGSGQLNYPATLPVAGTWRVKVVNGVSESMPYSFTVAAGMAQLTDLSISGPSSVNHSGSWLYTATAVFNDGSTPTVTPTWSLNVGAPAVISTSGQLTAGIVSGQHASHNHGDIYLRRDHQDCELQR